MKYILIFTLLILVTISSVYAEVFFTDDFNREEIGPDWRIYQDGVTTYTIVDDELVYDYSASEVNKIWMHSNNHPFNLENVTRIDWQIAIDKNMEGKNFAQYLTVGEYSDTTSSAGQFHFGCGALNDYFLSLIHI